MQKFHFRLEALLKYRRQLTDQAQAELAQAVVSWQTELEKQQALLADQRRLDILMRDLQQKNVAIDELIYCHNYSLRLEKLISDQVENVMTAEQHKEFCREKLAETLKRQKLVEKIKEKRLAQYQEDLLRHEQQDLDEIGLQLFVREK